MPERAQTQRFLDSMGNIRKSRGATMIEVLVAFFISAVGFLGLASVQLLGAKNISSSNYRTLATIYAYDMAERMRSNPSAIALIGNAYESINPKDEEEENFSPGDTFCSTNCSVNEIAQRDAIEWNEKIQGEVKDGGLPNSVGRVEFDSDTNMHTITIEWVDVVIADNGRSDNTQIFELLVRI